MSNLNCPNCGHLIGNLDGVIAPKKAVADWYEKSPWMGERRASELYSEFTEQADRSDISAKAFGQALQRCGATGKRGSNGVRMWIR